MYLCIMVKTLLYMGAGFDDSFLFDDTIRNAYDRYILFDILPDTTFYKHEEYGYYHVSNEKQFLKLLKQNFGHYQRAKNRLYFPEYNIVYKLNVDCDKINRFRKGDVFIKNYVHPNIQDHIENRKILVNCDTKHKLSKNMLRNADVKHVPEFMYEDRCYCNYLDQF